MTTRLTTRLTPNRGETIDNSSESEESDLNEDYDDFITLPVSSYNDLIQILRSNNGEISLPNNDKEIQSENITVQATAIISLALTVLRKKREPKLLEHLVTLLRELLYSVKTGRSEKAHRLVSLGGIPILLQALVDALSSNNEDWRLKNGLNDATCASLFHVLATIGKKDKNFRPLCLSCGAVQVSLNSLRSFRSKPKLLQSVLLFLKILAAKQPTVGALVTEGLVETLKNLLLDSRSKNGGRLPSSLVTLYILQVLCAAARRSKLAVSQMSTGDSPIGSSSDGSQTEGSRNWERASMIRVMVNLLDPNVWTGSGVKKSPRMAKLMRTVLSLLNNAASHKNGKQCLLSGGFLPVLYSWARALPPQAIWSKHVSLVSSIVQRSLPPLILPLRFPDSYWHPVKTHLPLSEDEDSDSHVRVSSDDESSSSDDDSEYEIEDEECEKENREDEKRTNQSQVSPGVEKTKEFRSQLGDEELCAYGAFFREFRSSSPPPPNSGELIGAREYCDNQTGEEVKQNGLGGCAAAVKNLYRSAKESMCREKFLNKLDFDSLYHKCSEQTKTPIRWVDHPPYPGGSSKMEYSPYGEIKNTKKKTQMEPFYHQPPSLIRDKTLEHVAHRVDKYDKNVTSNAPEYDARHTRAVFDLDNLLRRNNASEMEDSKSSNSLRFESRFESGNLRKAFRVGEREYDLLLSPDINKDYYLQWFYFRVSNFKVEGSSSPYVFNIINCEKSTSQFNSGMQPVMYSVKTNSWRRVGEDVCYFRNHYVRRPCASGHRVNRMDKWKTKTWPYYTLTFSVRFTDEDDVCYLAYFYPYTFSLLKLHLYCWEHSYDSSSVYYKRDEICQTLMGNPVYLLTITQKPLNPSRRYVVLSARVHPGESNSSWVLKGVLDYLLSDTRRAKKLRQTYVFKILPMLNPDGVIGGCHRCSLSGMDLNRQWASPSCSLHPPIFHTKALIQHLTAHRGPPLVYCDFHGHSRKHNVFLYGCNPSQSWLRKDRTKPDNGKSYLTLAELLSQSAPAFSFDDCSFEIEAGKEATGRVTVWREFKVSLSYTMECTFSGCDRGPYAGSQLAIEQLTEMGGKFAQALAKLSPA